MTIFHRVTEGKLGSHDGCAIEDEASQEFLDRIPGGLFRYRADDEGGTIDYVSRDVLELSAALPTRNSAPLRTTALSAWSTRMTAGASPTR